MPTKQVTAYISGFAGLLFNERSHHKVELLGVTVDNQHTAPETIKLYDCFSTTSGYFMSGGATRTMENLGSTNVLSGKVRLQMTVPAGETQKLGREDLAGTEFVGRGAAIASAETSDCVIVVQYGFKKG
jgi:hypothetical protein